MASFETYPSAPKAYEDETEIRAAHRAPDGFRRMVHALCNGLQRPMLRKEKEHALIKRAQLGDLDAVEDLVYAHKAYLVGATRVQARRAEGVIDAADLQSAALTGFLTAIQRWTPEQDARLATFADYHVTGAVKQQILDFSAPVRIATNSDQRRAWTQLGRMRRAFREAHGREMQESLHDAELAVRFSTPNAKGEKVNPKALLTLMGAMRQRYSVSIDDIQISTRDPANCAETQVLMADMRALLQTHIGMLRDRLRPRDLEIFTTVAADPDGKGVRQALADKHNMTPERVGQIYRAALADIRTSLRQVGVRSPSDAM